jgi:hypothetical protein
MHNAPPAWAEQRWRGPVTVPTRTVPWPDRSRSIAHVADISTQQAYIERAPHVVASAELAGYRTVLPADA